MRVALATSEALRALHPTERPLLAELARLGVQAEPAVWTDGSVDWRRYDAVIIRTPWDYFHHLEQFTAWLADLERAGVAVWNPPATIRWNLHKRYLRELEGRGVRVVPTVWVEQGARTSLRELKELHRLHHAVVKPAVSANAFDTWVARGEAADEARFAAAAARGEVMVQAYLPEIEVGELSFLFFGSALSHVVRKTPAPGDFRVQPDYGGVATRVAPDARLVAQARAVLAVTPHPWLYARVDAVERGGELLLMELELLEPFLPLAVEEEAAARFARAVVERLAPG